MTRRLPLWGHAALLALVLCAGLVLSRPGPPFTSDEASALLQARLLVDEGTWRYEYPLADLDPEGVAEPFARRGYASEHSAPYAKHLLYPVVLAPAVALGGTVGAIALSVAGTVGAALVAARLARRFEPRLEVAALWVTGVGSPLLFDSWLALAHTLAAAATGVAVLGAVRSVEGRGRDRTAWALVGLGTLLAGLLRSEGLLVGPALVVGLAAAAWPRRERVVALVPTAVVAAVGTAVALAVDTVAERAVIGEVVDRPIARDGGSWLAGRLQGLEATLVNTGYEDGGADELLVVGLVLVALGALAWRFRWAEVGSAAFLGGAACYLVVLGADPPWAVPGLLVATPLLVAGVLLAGRSAVATPPRRVVAATAAVVVVGVLATQHRVGGGIEWGGRYHALVLPLVVPLALASLAGAAARLVEPAPSEEAVGDGSAPREASAGGPAAPGAPGAVVDGATGDDAEDADEADGADEDGDRRRAVAVGVGCLVVVTLALSAAALAGHRQVHDATAVLEDVVAAAATEAGPAGERGRPVVVGDDRLLPLLLHEDFDEYLWVVPTRDDVPRSLARLAEDGAARVVLVSQWPGGIVEASPGWSTTRDLGRVGGRSILVLEHAEA